MAILTPSKLRQVLAIIERYHTAFAAGPLADATRDAYLFGQIIGTTDPATLEAMPYAEFERRAKQIKLSEAERFAVQAAQEQAGIYCKGLGNRIQAETGTVFIEADQALRRRFETAIQTATARNIARRETIQQLATDLGHRTQDWSRDLLRIATTEKQRALTEGQAQKIRKESGPQARVAVRPNADACPHCRALYLGSDGAPKIFALDDLEANGTNVGRKVAEWKPVKPPAHPHCKCNLVEIPPGWGFNEEGQLVPDGELGEAYEPMELSQRVHPDLVKSHKGDRLLYQGLPIIIETPRGEFKAWEGVDGSKGKTLMLYAYGYFENTEGLDGDEVDVFVGPDPHASHAFIIAQQNPHNGLLDEDKVMVGFDNERDAILAYQAHYDRNDFAVSIIKMEMNQLGRWLNVTTEFATIPDPENTDKLSKAPALLIKADGHRIPTHMGASYGRADSRNPSERGTGFNYGYNVPIPDKTVQIHPAVVDYFRNQKTPEDVDQARKQNRRDKEVYTVTEELHLEPRGQHFAQDPKGHVRDDAYASTIAEINREWLDNYKKLNTMKLFPFEDEAN